MSFQEGTQDCNMNLNLGINQRKDKKLHFEIVLKQALNSISLEYLTLMHQDGDKIARTKDYKDYGSKKVSRQPIIKCH